MLTFLNLRMLQTHRTPAVLTCLAACAGPMVSRDVFYPGGRHLLPLLELSLPGIDMNDPMKTVGTEANLSKEMRSLIDIAPPSGLPRFRQHGSLPALSNLSSSVT